MATINAPKQFSPVEDAENIKRACQGWGTDEGAIIAILGHRNATQRKLIRLAYEEIYQEDLIKQLQSELSGDFERAICNWTLDPADRDAVLTNAALQKAVPDYRAIIEIACISSPEELLAVRRAYRCRYKRSLEEDVASHTLGHIRKLLVAVVSAYRYDKDEFDTQVAHLEADILHEKAQEMAFDHEELLRILSTRSKAQLKATFNRYRDNHGTSITKGLSGDPADAYLAALRTTIRCIRDPRKYYAKVLRNAINTMGTDEDTLSRVIITRAEKDLKDIKELYFKRNNVTLDDALVRHTSGDYKAFLLALLGRDEV
ncbi:annexin D8 [Juglans microcarpa x Juglans regia]|uniref:annexin D8 n=1 Tax=Juglans microcarpa x Juglans regia TaxID=2249226 RepID=UPI001B7E6216|nr:annexin D8 [Juglans microcarpa x Juglans regia]